MSIATLTEFKEYIRELTNDLNSPLQGALDSATVEVNHFLGFDAEEQFGSSGVPEDIKHACMLLAQVHADAGDVNTNESRRTTAQRMMLPYRLNTGIGRLGEAA